METTYSEAGSVRDNYTGSYTSCHWILTLMKWVYIHNQTQVNVYTQSNNS